MLLCMEGKAGTGGGGFLEEGGSTVWRNAGKFAKTYA